MLMSRTTSGAGSRWNASQACSPSSAPMASWSRSARTAARSVRAMTSSSAKRTRMQWARGEGSVKLAARGRRAPPASAAARCSPRDGDATALHRHERMRGRAVVVAIREAPGPRKCVPWCATARGRCGRRLFGSSKATATWSPRPQRSCAQPFAVEYRRPGSETWRRRPSSVRRRVPVPSGASSPYATCTYPLAESAAIAGGARRQPVDAAIDGVHGRGALQLVPPSSEARRAAARRCRPRRPPDGVQRRPCAREAQ